MIQKTKNYALFSYIQGNRELNRGHLGSLTTSILKHNMLAENPIIVNEKMEIIDGQHRLEVAKNNKLEISYIVLEKAAITEVRLLNSHTREWLLRDYILSYANNGNKDYQWMLKLMEDYNLTPSYAILMIYSGARMWANHIVKSGKMELTEEQKDAALSRADLLYDLRPFIDKKGWLPKTFVRMVLKIHDKGQAKLLMAGIKKSGVPFTPGTSENEVSFQLKGFIDLGK